MATAREELNAMKNAKIQLDPDSEITLREFEKNKTVAGLFESLMSKIFRGNVQRDESGEIFVTGDRNGYGATIYFNYYKDPDTLHLIGYKDDLMTDCDDCNDCGDTDDVKIEDVDSDKQFKEIYGAAQNIVSVIEKYGFDGRDIDKAGQEDLIKMLRDLQRKAFKIGLSDSKKKIK